MEGPTILFLAGLALACGVLLFRTHRLLLGQPRSELSSPSALAPPAPSTAHARRLDAPPDLHRWELEMRRLADELQAELDSKVAIFEDLVRDARMQAGRLESALAQADQRAALSRADAKPPAAERNCASIDRTVFKPAGAPLGRHAEIYALADAGLSGASIASRLGSPIGEVELILGLRHSEISIKD